MLQRREYVLVARSIVVLSLLALFPGCQGTKTVVSSAGPEQGSPIGSLVDHTDCKQFLPVGVSAATPSNLDCVSYEYDGNGLLRLKHVNAAFNCCPGEITAGIKVEDSLITIVEGETESGCRCLCLYDLECVIENLPPGEYVVRVEEPYLEPGDEPLEFTVDLAAAGAGSHCVERTHYPWGVAQPPSGPSGALVGYTGCKGFDYTDAAFSADAGEDCMEYDYDGAGTLLLRHVNAAFNCCPGVITAYIVIHDGVITITENETDPNCFCLCLFDLDYRIVDLPPGEYLIRVEGLYLEPGDEPLEFTVDLAAAGSGSRCVERTHYPWDSSASPAPSGGIVEHTGCKETDYTNAAAGTGAELDCMEYDYDGAGTLLLGHVNAGFNCCPGEITADIDFDGGLITITEHESGPFCECLCLFDVGYKIDNLPPGDYTVRVVELYTGPEDPLLEFDLDLNLPSSGSHCEERHNYPWVH